jgi:flagellar biosynthesis protein FliQ
MHEVMYVIVNVSDVPVLLVMYVVVYVVSVYMCSHSHMHEQTLCFHICMCAAMCVDIHTYLPVHIKHMHLCIHT